MIRARWWRAGLMGLLLVLLAAPGATAQIPLPFFKKKKKDKPPAEQAAKAPAEAAAPGAKPPANPAAPGQADTTPAIAGPAVNLPAAAGPAGGPGPMSPEEKAALDQAIEQAIAADVASDTSVAHIQERLQRWLAIRFRAPDNQIVDQRLQQAQADLQASRQRALEAGKADQQSLDVIRSWIAAARTDLDSKNWGGAEQNLSRVLQQDPNHPEAKSLMVRLQREKKFGDLKRQALFIVPVLIVLAAGLVLVVRWGAKYREERQRKIDELAAKRAAVLQIVDGVGRGKLMTIDREKGIFKIGAALGTSEEERNDFVINDSEALVSRFHCTLVRKDGDYFLVDASMNGTWLNGKPVKRGDHYRLDDGDEITLAEVSRLKFLHT